jgi:hypothetical protein
VTIQSKKNTLKYYEDGGCIMKHPSELILMGYFENDLSETQDQKVQEHVYECEFCSDKLAAWAEVDSSIIAPSISLDESEKENLFSFIDELMDLKDNRKLNQQVKKDKRVENTRKVIDAKDIIFGLLERPTYALCALSAGIVLTYNVSKEKEYEPNIIFEDGVTVYYSEEIK